MTAALKSRTEPITPGCRFPDWCRGVCEDNDVERNHWSSQTRFWAFDLHDERIAVELWDYENSEVGVDPVLVYIAAGDHDVDEDGCPIPPEQARSLGTHLREFTPRNKYEDERVYVALDVDEEWAVVADYRHERIRRDDSIQDEHIEFSIRPDSTRRHSIRVRLSMDEARRLGNCLISEADRAAASNIGLALHG